MGNTPNRHMLQRLTLKFNRRDRPSFGQYEIVLLHNRPHTTSKVGTKILTSVHTTSTQRISFILRFFIHPFAFSSFCYKTWNLNLDRPNLKLLNLQHRDLSTQKRESKWTSLSHFRYGVGLWYQVPNQKYVLVIGGSMILTWRLACQTQVHWITPWASADMMLGWLWAIATLKKSFFIIIEFS